MNLTINLIVFIVGILLFIINWMLNKNFNIISYTVSQYAYGKYGFLTTLGFIFVGVGAVLVAIQMVGYSTTWLYKLIAYLVFAYGVCIGLLSVFRTDEPGKTTFRGRMHNILAITGLVTLTVNMILYLVFGSIVQNFSWATLLLFIPNLAGLLFLQFASDKYRGIYERITMFSQYFWLIYLLVSYNN